LPNGWKIKSEILIIMKLYEVSCGTPQPIETNVVLPPNKYIGLHQGWANYGPRWHFLRSRAGQITGWAHYGPRWHFLRSARQPHVHR